MANDDNVKPRLNGISFDLNVDTRLIAVRTSKRIQRINLAKSISQAKVHRSMKLRRYKIGMVIPMV